MKASSPDPNQPVSGLKRLVLIAIGICCGVAVVSTAWTAWSLFSGVRELRDALRSTQSALATGDQAQVVSGIEEAADAMDRVQVAMWSPQVRAASLLPWLGRSVHDLQLMSDAGAAATQAAKVIAPAYRSDLFKSGVINLVAVPDLLHALEMGRPQLDTAAASLIRIQGGGPGSTLLLKLRDQGLAATGLATSVAVRLSPHSDAVLKALGADGPRHYMVAFQNPAELRASGGAPLSAAVLGFDHGRISVVFSGYVTKDADRGDERAVFKPASPPPWLPPNGGVLFIDANTHPDWRLAGEDLMRAWNVARKPQLQGIAGLDTRGIEAVLRATGPMEVAGYGTLDADNFSAKVTEDAYVEYAGKRVVRQDLNQKVASMMIDRLLSADAQTLAATAVGLSTQAPGRHLQFRIADPVLQRAAELSDAAGAVTDDRNHDVIGFFSRNLNASKNDVYSQRAVASTVDVGVDGSATVVQTLTVYNDVPHTLKPSRTHGYLSAWSDNEWYLYLPQGATGASLDVPVGFLPMSLHPDGLGRTVAITRGKIAPRAGMQVVLRYQLPTGTFRSESGAIHYRIDLNPQPIAHDASTEVELRVPAGMRCAADTGWQPTAEGARWKGPLAVDTAVQVDCG